MSIVIFTMNDKNPIFFSLFKGLGQKLNYKNMEHFGVIYKVTNLINGKIYIGQTTHSVDSRFADYSKSKYSIIGKAIKKYKPESFKKEIICRCNSIEEMNHREAYYIRLFKTLAPLGYNLDSGGRNKKLHTLTKQKLSKQARGRPSAFKGKKSTEKTRRTISEKNRFNYRTGKVIHPMTGKHHDEKVKNKIADTLTKYRVRGTNIYDGSIIVFENTKTSDKAGYFYMGIKNFIKGVIKTAYKGYLWELIPVNEALIQEQNGTLLIRSKYKTEDVWIQNPKYFHKVNNGIS